MSKRVLREGLLVLAVAAFQVFTAHAGGERDDSGIELDALGVVLLVVGPLTLPLRVRAIWFTVGVSVLAGVVYFSLGYPGAAIFASVVVALVALRRRRTAELREQREREREQRAVQQRLALARELHDVLAHSISVIRVQAGVALHLMDADPSRVRPALEAITAASDDGMRELRAAVGTLRRAEGGAPLAPTPGLARVDDLVRAARGSTLGVTLERTGTVRDLSPDVELAAYRVVQESLTNTVRHATAAHARVRLAYGDAALLVEVCDDGRADATAVEGNGLRGMRERVQALAGSLEAAPTADGFRVRARLPLGTA